MTLNDEGTKGTVIRFDNKLYISYTEDDGVADTMEIDPTFSIIDASQRLFPPNTLQVGQVVHMPVIIIDSDASAEQLKDFQGLLKMTLEKRAVKDAELMEKIWDYRKKYQTDLWDFETRKWIGPADEEPGI
jgi:hypothetical protein